MLFRPFMFLVLFCFSFGVLAVDLTQDVTITADLMEYDGKTSISVGTGNVVIKHLTMTLTADRVSVNQNTNDFTATGHVVLSDQDMVWKTHKVWGNLATKDIKFGPFRAEGVDRYMAGKSGKRNQDGKITMNHTWLSSCCLIHPHYQMESAKITYYESDYYTAKHVVLKFFDIPVLYFPFIWGCNNDELRTSYIIKPGYSGDKGAFLRFGRSWTYSEEKGKAKVYVDGMSKRGAGIGIENDYADEKRESDIIVYQLHDHVPLETKDGYERRFESREDRHRIKVYYRENLNEGLNIRANLEELSDIDMMEEWFSNDYDGNNQPKSFAEITYNHEYFDAGLTIRPQINDFYTVMETLPEFRFNIPSIQLGDTPFVYNSESSMGYYSLKWRDFDITRDSYLPASYVGDERDELSDYAAWRMDSLHTIKMPVMLNGFLNFIPRASFRVTSYSRSSKKHLTEQDHINNIVADCSDYTSSLSPVTNYDDLGGSKVRFASELGFELNSKFISSWSEYDSDFWDLHRMRHVIQPYLNYTFAPEPSEDREQLYYFDEVDRLTRQNFLRLGVDQRFQTTRKDKVVNWLIWQSYLDSHFADYEDYEHTFGIWGNKFELEISELIHASCILAYEVPTGAMQRASTRVTFGKTGGLNLTIGHQFYNEILPRAAYSMGSFLEDFTGQSGYLKSNYGTAESLTTSVHVPINEKTWFDAGLSFDMEEHNVSSHYYKLTRVMHCWTGIFGVAWSNNVFKGIVMFQLTAFPNIGMDFDYR